MMNEALWRKTPTNLLTDETMQFIERQLPTQYAYAPYMFYQACLKKADVDGIFDIDDGVIFANLMRVPSVQLVFKIAELMVRRKVIYQIKPGVNKCMLVDWDYNKNDVKRSMEERRAIAQRQIDEAARRNSVSTFIYIAPENAENLPENSSFCTFDDKKLENVDKNTFDDKNKKNVDKSRMDDKKLENVDKNTFDDKNTKNVDSIEREKERERDRQIDKKDTHTHNKEREIDTEIERQKEAGASAGQMESPATAPARQKKALSPKEKRATEVETENLSENIPEADTESLAAEAIQSAEVVENKEDRVVQILTTFFCERNLGYDLKKGAPMVAQIAEKVRTVAGKKFSAEKVAEVICSEFRAMHEEQGVWHDIPLYPVYMLKDSVWAYLLTQTAKKLKAAKSSKFYEEVKRYEAQASEEREKTVDEFNRAFTDRGIDPNDPLATQKLLMAKSLEAAKTVDSVEDEAFEAYGGGVF